MTSTTNRARCLCGSDSSIDGGRRKRVVRSVGRKVARGKCPEGGANQRYDSNVEPTGPPGLKSDRLLGIFRDDHRRPRLHREGSVAQARPSGLHARDTFSPNLSRSGSIKSSARITKRWTRPANALRTRQATGLANMRTYTHISA